MPTLFGVLWAALLLGLVACSPGSEQGGTATAGPVEPPAPPAGDASAAPAARAVEPTWREDWLVLGQNTYVQVCAGCHDEGAQGAPVTGRREDWAGRSDMWQAVLADHAKSGYLDMPGRGGQPTLSDDAVEAATEYMLGQTFPERPTD